MMTRSRESDDDHEKNKKNPEAELQKIIKKRPGEQHVIFI